MVFEQTCPLAFMTKTVLVTGASQGISKTTPIELARREYDSALVACQIERLEAVA